MIFSSPTFLFLFLPIVIALSMIPGRASKNLTLLVASLLFYAWGEAYFVLIMLCSITFNFIFGLFLEDSRRNTYRKAFLVTGITLNLGLLAYFKYANFVIENINGLTLQSGFPAIEWSPVHLPLGISFFTFQAMSYLIDVYRGESKPERNIINVALYISLFPQLIAGPIVRYHDIAGQIKSRALSLKLANSGIQRFVFGLAKKVLIANPLGLVADQIFSIESTQLTPGLAWLGIICYTLQIYFDFSGYSDMAIGLGRMFGFKFLENFNYPYVTRSITMFWRCWHISLSSWFRDYLYIPLGGNRKGAGRTYANLLVVFCLCGLWHGASWTFLVWGLFHGTFLVLERLKLSSILVKLPVFSQHIYTLLVVMAGWVFFRTESMGQALQYFEALAGFSSGNGDIHYVEKYLDLKIVIIIFLGMILSTPAASRLNGIALKHINEMGGSMPRLQVSLYSCVNLLVLISLASLCLMSIASNAYDPFIYFRF